MKKKEKVINSWYLKAEQTRVDATVALLFVLFIVAVKHDQRAEASSFLPGSARVVVNQLY